MRARLPIVKIKMKYDMMIEGGAQCVVIKKKNIRPLFRWFLLKEAQQQSKECNTINPVLCATSIC